MKRFALFLLFCAFGLMTPVAEGVAAQDRCLTQHEQMREVRSGRVVRPSRVERTLGGQILRMRLCHGGGGLVWQARVLSPDGRVRARVLDAHSGRPVR